MSAPNLMNLSSIFGKTALQVATTSAADILENAAASNTVVKVNTIFASNKLAAATVTIRVVRSATNYSLATGLTVPAGSSILVLGGDGPIYLEEGDKIQILSSDADTIDVIIGYEVIA